MYQGLLQSSANNIVWHQSAVNRGRREMMNRHRSINLWFSGLSGSGKSTLAHAVEERLHLLGCRTYVFDGDNVRHGLCSDLTFSEQDRSENIRRIAEMVKLFLDAGVIAITAFISPLKKDRDRVKQLLGPGNHMLIYCRCPLAVCEARDVKGLYKKARAGEIRNYTGISSPFEAPADADLVLDTGGGQSLAECVELIVRRLVQQDIVMGLGEKRQISRG
ncbi:MAG: adenylyl-sulfate kinase [Deltaproteobacteria bacterium RIFOXYD12_FULL_57_12]|nr:MAG: adenylyl-sulfate kinase [Deltaproteobacteria bacterium RIFOXYD12_FULL_57_12]